MNHNDLYAHFLTIRDERNNELNELYKKQFESVKSIFEAIPRFWVEAEKVMTPDGLAEFNYDIGIGGVINIKISIAGPKLSLVIDYHGFFRLCDGARPSDLYSGFYHYAENAHPVLESLTPDASSIIVSPLNDGIKICIDYKPVVNLDVNKEDFRDGLRVQN